MRLCENSTLWKFCPMKNTRYTVLYVHHIGGRNRSFSMLTWVTWTSLMTILCQGQIRTVHVSQKHFSLNFSLIFTRSLWSCDVLWSPIWLTYYTVPWKPYVQKTVCDSTSALVLPCSLSRSELLVSTSGCSTLSTWLRHWLQRLPLVAVKLTNVIQEHTSRSTQTREGGIGGEEV